MSFRWASFRATSRLLIPCALVLAAAGCQGDPPPADPAKSEKPEKPYAIMKTDEEWKKILTPEQYRVLRRQGTEPAFTGEFWDHHAPGEYLCAGCGQKLFGAETKFDSGTGWPSFHSPASPECVETLRDSSHGMIRDEVVCSRCGGHLGHVFPDGPRPTGLRYCINSASLRFEKKEGE